MLSSEQFYSYIKHYFNIGKVLHVISENNPVLDPLFEVAHSRNELLEIASTSDLVSYVVGYQMTHDDKLCIITSSINMMDSIRDLMTLSELYNMNLVMVLSQEHDTTFSDVSYGAVKNVLMDAMMNTGGGSLTLNSRFDKLPTLDDDYKEDSFIFFIEDEIFTGDNYIENLITMCNDKYVEYKKLIDKINEVRTPTRDFYLVQQVMNNDYVITNERNIYVGSAKQAKVIAESIVNTTKSKVVCVVNNGELSDNDKSELLYLGNILLIAVDYYGNGYTPGAVRGTAGLSKVINDGIKSIYLGSPQLITLNCRRTKPTLDNIFPISLSR